MKEIPLLMTLLELYHNDIVHVSKEKDYTKLIDLGLINEKFCLTNKGLILINKIVGIRPIRPILIGRVNDIHFVI